MPKSQKTKNKKIEIKQIIKFERIRKKLRKTKQNAQIVENKKKQKNKN